MINSTTQDDTGCYSIQLMGLCDRASDIINLDNAGPSIDVDVLTAVQQIYEGDFPRRPSVVTKFA